MICGSRGNPEDQLKWLPKDEEQELQPEDDEG
jgi:hypothetical protein